MRAMEAVLVWNEFSSFELRRNRSDSRLGEEEVVAIRPDPDSAS